MSIYHNPAESNRRRRGHVARRRAIVVSIGSPVPSSPVEGTRIYYGRPPVRIQLIVCPGSERNTIPSRSRFGILVGSNCGPGASGAERGANDQIGIEPVQRAYEGPVDWPLGHLAAKRPSRAEVRAPSGSSATRKEVGWARGRRTARKCPVARKHPRYGVRGDRAL
jgi:hypothetical protein